MPDWPAECETVVAVMVGSGATAPADVVGVVESSASQPIALVLQQRVPSVPSSGCRSSHWQNL